MRGHLHHPDPLTEALLAERLRFAAPPAAHADHGGGGGGQAVELPFLYGSNRYEETPFYSQTITLDADSHEISQNITPGGFLCGVLVQVTSANGVIGTANLAADAPWALISSLSIEDISGDGILKPMSGFAHLVKQKYFSPWDGDPALRSDYSSSINPGFTLRAMVEIRDTLAVLANTDARAQYRVKLTVAPLGKLVDVAGNVTTAPDVTVKLSFITWAQPDAEDLLGNPISPTPLGEVATRIVQHQLIDLSAGDNTPRFELTGNEIRALAMIVRDSTGARVDLTDANAGPIRFSLDSRSEWKKNPSQLVESMAAFYELLGAGVWSRETGVYVLPRFRQPGKLLGEFWLQTVEQNNLRMELEGADLGANVPGSLEVIYDNISVEAGMQLPVELEGI